MVNCMSAAPEIVGGQGEYADDAADPIISQTTRKERAMTAVVLDHEQAQEKAGGRNCDEGRRPAVAEPEGEPRRRPERHQRHCRDRQLGNAARVARRTINGERW